ncbi:MAG: hypothetical protein ACKVVT_11530 [Dehalococcoidia bacterium]
MTRHDDFDELYAATDRLEAVAPWVLAVVVVTGSVGIVGVIKPTSIVVRGNAFIAIIMLWSFVGLDFAGRPDLLAETELHHHFGFVVASALAVAVTVAVLFAAVASRSGRAIQHPRARRFSWFLPIGVWLTAAEPTWGSALGLLIGAAIPVVAIFAGAAS